MKPYRFVAPVASWLALAALSCAHTSEQSEDWVTARRDNLKLKVDVTGTLRAVQSDLLGPPDLEDVWDFKISFMAPEGAQVKKGDPVLRFDDTELTRKLALKQNETASVNKQIEKKLSDAQMARRDEELKIAEAEAKLRKAAAQGRRPDRSGRLDRAREGEGGRRAGEEGGRLRARARRARRSAPTQPSSRRWASCAGAPRSGWPRSRSTSRG